MDLNEKADRVRTREDFAQLLLDVLADLRKHPDGWENDTLEDFLEAWAAWVGSMPGWYMNRGEPMPDLPDWKVLANMVMAARVYE